MGGGGGGAGGYKSRVPWLGSWRGYHCLPFCARVCTVDVSESLIGVSVCMYCQVKGYGYVVGDEQEQLMLHPG